MKNSILYLIPLLASLSVTSCTTYHDIDIRPQTSGTGVYDTAPPLRSGDHVRIALTNGKNVETVIQSVNSRYLIGADGVQLPMDQISSLERKEISGGKTAAATGAGIGVGAFVIVAILSAGLATALIAAGG